MDTKTRPYICCLQETYTKPMETYKLIVRGWKKVFYANGDQKKVGLANISDKIGFRMKTIIRIKEGCYIMTKRSIQVEDITIINIYAPA